MADRQAGAWYVERGIGEERALFTRDGKIEAAKIHWPGELYAGLQIEAKLSSKASGSLRGSATTANGQDILVDHLPANITEGQTIGLTVTRAPISERGRSKLAHGRHLADSPAAAQQWLADGTTRPEFASGSWEDIWQAAASGEVEFNGGSLHFSVTPAMTLIDIDGTGSPKQLALAAVPIIAHWLPAFDLGGSIGIDFPTIEAKADRKLVDIALAEALADWPHERTAMNGFGFVQLVARFEGPSLLHRFATSRVGMCARYALRVAELAQGDGPVLLLRVHPALNAKLKPEWIEELARRSGRQVEIETDPGLALESPQAQIRAS